MCDLNKIDHEDLAGNKHREAQAARRAVKDYKNSTSPLSLPSRQADAYGKIPSLEGMDYIKDAKLEDVLADTKSQPDLVPNAMDQAIGSKEMLAQTKRSSALFSVGHWLTNGSKRHAIYQSERLTPLGQTLHQMVASGDGAHLMAVIKQEDMANARLTPEERATVLNPKQDEAYVQFREELDIALERQNQALEAAGHPRITAREAYVASRWGGDWKIQVMDKTGKRVFYIAETSKGRAEHALAYLAKRHPDIIDTTASKLTHSSDAHNKQFEGMAGYREALALIGESDARDLLRKTNEARIEVEGSRIYGQQKHFEPKTGERGALGDQPWKNDATNVRDWFNSQMDYLSNAHKWSEMQGAIDNIKQFLSDPDIAKDYPGMSELVKKMTREELGFATDKGWKQVENGLSGLLSRAMSMVPGLNKVPTDISSLNRGQDVVKTAFYIKVLGVFQVPFAVMNMVQPLFVTPHHIRLSNEGFKHNPFQTLMDSQVMMAATAIPTIVHGFSGVKLDGAKHIPEIFREAYNYMDANGMLGHTQFSDVGSLMSGKNGQRVMDTLQWTITAPEKIARTNAFMGYVSHLKQARENGSFKGSDIEMFQKAEELTNLSMVNYNRTERAGAIQKAGLTGSGAATLMAFKINQLNQLYDFGKDIALAKGPAAKAKAATPLIAMMGIQLAMGGALAFYGVTQADELWEYIKKSAIDDGYLTDPEVINFSIKGWALDNMPTLASMGALSEVTGANFSSRYDLGSVGQTTDAAFPHLQDAAKTAAAWIAFAKKSNQETFDQAAVKTVPTSLRGATEMALPTPAKDGNYYKASDPAKMVYERTDKDKTYRSTPFIGMNTVEEFKAKDNIYRDGQKVVNKTAAKTQIVNELKRILTRDGDGNVDELMEDYINLGGKKDILNKQFFKEAALNRALNSYDRMAISKGKGKIDRLQTETR